MKHASSPDVTRPGSRAIVAPFMIKVIQAALLGVATVLSLYLLLFGSGYYLFIATRFCAFVIIVLSANLLFGYGHQIFVAHGALVGIGAYSFAIALDHGADPVLAGLLAIIITMVVGSITSLPAIRLQGLYLAIASLAFQFGMSGVFEAWTDVTGGYLGLSIEPLAAADYGPLSKDQFWFLLAATSMMALTLACARLVHGSFGRSLAALRDSVHASQSLGANPFVWRFLVFALASALAAAGGVFLAGPSAHVSPPSYSVNQTLLILLAVIVGGRASIAGSILGAIVAVALPELLTGSKYADYQSLVFAVVVIVTLILLPEGLATLPRRLRGLSRKKRQEALGVAG